MAETTKTSSTKGKAEADERDYSKTETLTVYLAGASEAQEQDVRTLATRLGGFPGKVSGGKMTVESPAESFRNPDDKRMKLIQGLEADPLVVKVESS